MAELLSLLLALLPPTAVSLPGAASPDGRFLVAIEADVDSPSFGRYGLKGNDDEFPAYIVVDPRTGGVVGRVPWLTAARPGEQPMRKRTAVIWRPDSHAVAINSSEPHYLYAQILSLDSTDRRFEAVALPDFEQLLGHPPPLPEHLASTGIERAVRWLPIGDLLLELRLFDPRSESYPLWYEVTLRLDRRHLTVVGRVPLYE